jgi:hypothetical protein
LEGVYYNMKKLAIYLLVLSVFIACNNDSKPVNQSSNTETSTVDSAQLSAAAPVIKFDKDVYDFGKIKQGESVAYDFSFTNNGKSPLIIKDAVATCGCTVPEPPKDPILPGQSAKIKVVFNSAGKEGLQDKVVTITANTIPAQTQIHLIGEVLK